MKTREQLKKRFDTRLKLAKNSTLYSDSDKNDYVNDAIVWVGSQFKWPQREMCAQYTAGTEAGYGYYDYPNYPVNFAPMSIRTLIIDDIEYEQREYHDLMRLLREEPTPSDDVHYFANYGTWFFIYPIINISGLEIRATGVVQPNDLSSDDDKTIWSDDMEQLNEAVLSMMLFYATGKIEHLNLAQTITNLVWSKFAGERQKDVPIDRPFLIVPDFFNERGN